MWPALARFALVILWTAITVMVAFIGWRVEKLRPYACGLVFIPIINVFFYLASLIWHLNLITVPVGFFSDLSSYRSWATAINLIIVLIVPTIELWTSQARR